MTECKMTQSALAMALALTSHPSSRFSGVRRFRAVPAGCRTHVWTNLLIYTKASRAVKPSSAKALRRLWHCFYFFHTRNRVLQIKRTKNWYCNLSSPFQMMPVFLAGSTTCFVSISHMSVTKMIKTIRHPRYMGKMGCEQLSPESKSPTLLTHSTQTSSLKSPRLPFEVFEQTTGAVVSLARTVWYQYKLKKNPLSTETPLQRQTLNDILGLYPITPMVIRDLVTCRWLNKNISYYLLPKNNPH